MRISRRASCTARFPSSYLIARRDFCYNSELMRRSLSQACGQIHAAPTHCPFQAKLALLYLKLSRESSRLHNVSWVTSWVFSLNRYLSTSSTSLREYTTRRRAAPPGASTRVCQALPTQPCPANKSQSTISSSFKLMSTLTQISMKCKLQNT